MGDFLRMIGLAGDFAPLVLVLGHGSGSRNNPHLSAYDCGACSGRHGGPNARALVAMANRPEVRARLAGRGLHMCGQSTHLHQVLVEDLRISSFDLFGYMVEPAVAARNLGGKMQLWGNISPMLMLDGTVAQVKQAALEALEALAPCGGFRLGDGANVCPGTPIESLAALTEAAEEYGAPS